MHQILVYSDSLTWGIIPNTRKGPIEPGMQVPPILIVCPPQIRSPQGSIAAKFRGSEQRSAGLAEAYMQAASNLACECFDAESATRATLVDGVHLDSDQHLKLGNTLAEIVQPMLRDHGGA